MFANCQLMGTDLAFPDVCKTPPALVPIPYPNIALGPMAIPNAWNVLIMGMPAHNLLTPIPLSNGDNAGLGLGLVSQTVMSQARPITCVPNVLFGCIPATRLTGLSTQNTINTVGMRVTPSQIKVLLLGAGAGAGAASMAERAGMEGEEAAAGAEAGAEAEATAGEAAEATESVESAPKRPSWRQSEKDVGQKLGKDYREQVSFKDGEEVPYGTKGSTRPDFYKPGESVEVKNYNVETPAGQQRLVENVSNQAVRRAQELPPNTTQSLRIDVRGQQVTRSALRDIEQSIKTRSNGIISRIDIVK